MAYGRYGSACLLLLYFGQSSSREFFFTAKSGRKIDRTLLAFCPRRARRRRPAALTSQWLSHSEYGPTHPRPPDVPQARSRPKPRGRRRAGEGSPLVPVRRHRAAVAQAVAARCKGGPGRWCTCRDAGQRHSPRHRTRPGRALARQDQPGPRCRALPVQRLVQRGAAVRL